MVGRSCRRLGLMQTYLTGLEERSRSKVRSGVHSPLVPLLNSDIESPALHQTISNKRRAESRLSHESENLQRFKHTEFMAINKMLHRFVLFGDEIMHIQD